MRNFTSATLKQYKWIAAGILFAILWASASTATKIGLAEAQPLVIAEVRFIVAGLLMLLFSHIIKRYRLPSGREWKHLAVYGLLNITVYLGCYFVAMQHVTAGIGSLAIATNPLFISLLSLFFLKKRLPALIIIAIVLGTAGVTTASLPLLKEATVTTGGLFLLLFSMFSYSAGAIYFSVMKLNDLNLFTINGWSTLMGGIFLLPFTLLSYHNNYNHFTSRFWASLLWLVVPVSVFAVQLWLWLLKTDAVKAGLWLFLCPVFGFAIAAWLINDIITSYTIAGVALVMTGLFLAQINSRQKPLPDP